MKSFDKPFCEVIRFDGGVMTASSSCGCWDGEDDWGKVCTGDVGYCACTVNHNPAQDNCTTCSEWNGD